MTYVSGIRVSLLAIGAMLTAVAAEAATLTEASVPGGAILPDTGMAALGALGARGRAATA